MPGIPISGPSIVPDFSGQDCKDIVGTFSKLISQFVNGSMRIQQARDNKVQKDFEVRKAGGLWDKITADPMAQFEAAVKSAVTDATDISSGKGGILSKYGQYMDMGQNFYGMMNELASGAVSTVVDEMGIIGQLTDPSGFGSLLPTSQNASCDGNLVAASVKSAFRVAGRVVNNGAQAVFGVMATMGLTLEVLPDLYAGLMSLPASSLATLMVNRKSLMDRISATAKDAADLAKTIKASDYPFDHRSFILAAKADIDNADGDLSQVEATLEAGGSFLSVNWDRARSLIDSTGDRLMGAPGIEMTEGRIRLIKLLGFQKLTQNLIDILQQRQAVFAQIVGFIGSYKSTFDKHAKFGNLAGPLVQQVRCTLQRMTDDMSRSSEDNIALKLVFKEKQWGGELIQLAKFMGPSDRWASVSRPISDLNKAADALSDGMGANTSSLSSSEEYGAIIAQLNSILRELKRKTISNVSTEIMESVSEALIRNIEIVKSNDSEVGKLLTGFSSAFSGSAAVTVLQGVTGIVGLLNDQNLTGMIDKLKSGDIKSFFSVDSIKSQLESLARKAIGEVAACCTDNSDDADVQSRLESANKVMLSSQRGKDLYDKYVRKYADNHIKESTTRDAPRLQRMKQDINSISRSKCINKGSSGQGAAVGLILR
jgi:hypothetical protein